MQFEQFLFFDVETTGINRTADRIVQIAWVLADRRGNVTARECLIVKPEGYSIPARAAAIHGIDTRTAHRIGTPAADVLSKFAVHAATAGILVGHNVAFDFGIVSADLRRHAIHLALHEKLQICTMRSSSGWCRIPKTNGLPGFKFPRLDELHYRLFGEDFANAHDAMADVQATMRCFYELIRLGVIVLPNLDYVADQNRTDAPAIIRPFSRPQSEIQLTRRSHTTCKRCKTIIEVTLNHGDVQVACPKCHSINWV